MNKSLLLIDGNNLLFRALHGWAAAAPTTEGRVEQVMTGFLALALRPVHEFQPTHLLVVFDADSPTFRHEAHAAYKANRRERKGADAPARYLPALRTLLQRLGVVHCTEPGVEADDVIASAAVQAAALDTQVIIYSNDRDFLQLVTEDIVVRVPARNQPLYTVETVWRCFQVHPYQFVDYKALQGDVSDNLPGVPGIGPKTAAQLLRRHETLENLYAHLWLVPERLAQLLRRYEARVWHNQTLIRLRRDLPLAFSLTACELDQAIRRLNPFDAVRRLQQDGSQEYIRGFAHDQAGAAER